jgi:hypothetical protein
MKGRTYIVGIRQSPFIVIGENPRTCLEQRPGGVSQAWSNSQTRARRKNTEIKAKTTTPGKTSWKRVGVRNAMGDH